MSNPATSDLKAPQAPQRERVRELYFEKGLKAREISSVLHISTQRVYQHLAVIRAAMRLEHELEREEASA